MEAWVIEAAEGRGAQLPYIFICPFGCVNQTLLDKVDGTHLEWAEECGWNHKMNICVGCKKEIRWWHRKSTNKSWHVCCFKSWVDGYRVSRDFSDNENRMAGLPTTNELYVKRSYMIRCKFKSGRIKVKRDACFSGHFFWGYMLTEYQYFGVPIGR